LTKQSAKSHSNLDIASELRDKKFRDQFFRTERKSDIPAQIKTLRNLRGLSQSELAEMIGTKQSGISRLEHSSHGNWNLETLAKIAEALDARLAVVIEPYEVVIDRYEAAEKSAALQSK
jgi:transcriptional regulator with XRE-family HTH domain